MVAKNGRPPLVTELTRNGITRVAAFNDTGVVLKAVPLRDMGDVRVRQTSRVGRSIYVVTYREGDNTDPRRAYANGSYGVDGFRAMDHHIYLFLAQEKAFLSQPLSRPNGTGSAYQGVGG